ncbi:MAG TPA: DUF2157 domain-containing protein [Bryobacteraceae bacterium]|jgi:uncharacterized membrane protein|nr:DUF2157 domain-containing protein [Bryobacteraceae bacterium]
MPAGWEQSLAKWQDAGLIDPEAAARIRDFEGRDSGSARLRWPAIAAIAFGAMMLIAGVLLFVSAHWDEISPSTRFAMVVLMVAIFHAAGAYAAPRMDALAIALHGIGTATLGAGIYLSGQIFNMSEHWPSAILMWAVGAMVAWLLRRDWLQLTFLAILAPAWVAAEWVDAHSSSDQFVFRILCQGMLLLSIAYFTAPQSKALRWIGGLAILPWALALALDHQFFGASRDKEEFFAYAGAYALPLAVAFLLRRQKAWINVVAAVWVFLLNLTAYQSASPLLYLVCGLGAAGFVAWGMHEHRSERINLGMAGFAITVLCFYFSTVMDKLGRSESLIGLGVLFLAGGWALEKLRRRLVAQMRQSA